MAVKTDVIAENTPGAGVTIDGLLVKDGGLPALPGAGIDADEAAALAAYYAALAGASAGQVLTASGPGAAGFAAVTGGPSLSDYENVIVVDAGGNGDYDLLSDAISAASTKTAIFVFGDIADNGFPSASNKTLDIYFHNGELTGSMFLILNSSSRIRLFNPRLSMASTISVPTGAEIGIYGGHIIVSGSESAIRVDGGTLIAYGVTFESTGTQGAIRISDVDSAGRVIGCTAIGSTALGYTGTIISTPPIEFHGCTFSGAVSSAIPFANAPLYHNTFSGNPTSITVTSGNYSNVAAGVTWPAIP